MACGVERHCQSDFLIRLGSRISKYLSIAGQRDCVIMLMHSEVCSTLEGDAGRVLMSNAARERER